MDSEFEAEKINTDKAPKAVGPYSQAVKFGNMVFLSGQIGIDPQNGNLVEGGVSAQARQVLQNLGEVLTAAGSSVNKVLQTTIYIKNMDNYAEVNNIYAEVFNTDPLPARATVEVSDLPKGAEIEISCIAYI